MRPFEPVVRNPHALTILGNFWPRKYDYTAYPKERRLIRTEPDTQVLVETQRPVSTPLGHVVMLHGLEGSGESGYIRSMSWHLLERGYIVHRFHMRTCGGTENLCKTLYHAGQTSDLREFLKQLRQEKSSDAELPIFLAGFSLGGNVALKLAGEEGETDLIQAVCAVSTPIDLAASTRRIAEPHNSIYERRFVRRMKERMLATGRHAKEELGPLNSIWEIDDKITGPSFGFTGAAHYYETQSAKNFLETISVPTLLIQAEDDPYIPFEIFSHPAIARNRYLKLVTTRFGGHLGFLCRRAPRFWLDDVVPDFIQASMPTPAAVGRNSQCGD